MKGSETLLAEVSTGESSLSEELNDDEVFSLHDSSFEEDLKSEELFDDSDEEYFIKKDKCTKWYKIKFCHNVRIPAQNIITQLPGNVAEASNVTTPFASLLMLIGENILSNIINYTNIYITKIAENFHQDHDAKGTTVIELKALIDCCSLVVCINPFT